MGVHQSKETYSEIKKLLDIPPDEPIFIIRAQDKFSIRAIRYYRDLVRDGTRIKTDPEWKEQVGSVINKFIHWQSNNRNKVKVPD